MTYIVMVLALIVGFIIGSRVRRDVDFQNTICPRWEAKEALQDALDSDPDITRKIEGEENE